MLANVRPRSAARVPSPWGTHIHDVQLVPLDLAGAELVADEVDHEREERDVGGEGDPRQQSGG